MVEELPAYWHSRWLLERCLAMVYLVAFIVALNQFVPLLGEHGLLPVSRFVREVPFGASPSLFFFFPTDRAFTLAAWAGIVLSLAVCSGVAQRINALAGAGVWAGLWVLYLSFMNVGQTFYGFGWESLLLEAGFLTIFAGARSTAPHVLLNLIYRWTLFRVMFGAGLIKIRGDSCWRDLTCLDYYFETQPIPNPLSWYFHHLPKAILHGGVAFNHFAELAVPFAFFLPQPYCGVAGLITIVFQLTLIVSGNLSWLNWLTLTLAFSTLDRRWLSWLPVSVPALRPMAVAERVAAYGLAVLVAVLSVPPVLNMLSSQQVMNTSFNALQIVNTYGAFGSITRERYEIAIEGTDDEDLSDKTVWREYLFRGKPDEPSRMPAQIAPYHLRLDWLMWFAAMSGPDDYPWFPTLLVKLLEGDGAILGLLRTNPFPEHPPRWVRAQRYLYRFTTPSEHRATGDWWKREPAGLYFPAVRLQRSTVTSDSSLSPAADSLPDTLNLPAVQQVVAAVHLHHVRHAFLASFGMHAHPREVGRGDSAEEPQVGVALVLEVSERLGNRHARVTQAARPQVLVVSGDDRTIVCEHHPQAPPPDEVGVRQVLHHVPNRPFALDLRLRRFGVGHSSEQAADDFRCLPQDVERLAIPEQAEERARVLGGFVLRTCGRVREYGHELTFRQASAATQGHPCDGLRYAE
jgi:hypothetical protein